jgi:hypothetical protein
MQDHGGNRRRETGQRRRIPCLRLTLLTACPWVCSVLIAQSSAVEQNGIPPGRTSSQGRQKTRGTPPDTRNVLHWELHPTATIAEERRRRRRLEKSRTNETETDAYRYTLPQHWFDARKNAVYATIPDAADPSWQQENDPQMQDFHDFRHLSRYERQHRTLAGHDLQHGWNGTYEFKFNGIDQHQHQHYYHNNGTLPPPADSFPNIPSRFRRQKETREPKQQQQQRPQSGGQFNNYQAVPLSQGYGTHFANVWVGSGPQGPQRKTVIVDTGSHYTAFPCEKCRHCGGPHHTDPYFAPSKSVTFHKLQCDECTDGVVCDNGECKFEQHYTEGSSWEAIQVKDRVYCGGSDILDSVEPGDEKYAIDFMFGCQTSMTGLFVTQLADGIMGMSAHEATLPKKLYNRNMLEHNMFAMCYRRELGTSKRGVTAGSMTLGGVSNNLDTSPMVYANIRSLPGWYTVYVKNIYIRSGGGQSAQSIDTKHQTIKVRMDPKKLNSGKGVIVDSGTTDTYVNKQVLQEFNKAWKKATGKTYSHSPVSLTDEQLRRLPTILIQCDAYTKVLDPSIESYDSMPGYAGKLDPSSPNDLLIAIPATSYMEWSHVTNAYSPRVYFTESAGGVLGSNAMQGHNVLFDWENGRVGFAESSCTYDKKKIPKAAEDEGFPTDCEIGDPVLSVSCIENVDRRNCKNNPTNIALLGTERWAAIVKSPGNDAGLTCVEATKDATSKNRWDEPVVQCDGRGSCEESRPCQLTCSQALKASEVVPLSPLDLRQKKCGDSLWGACDYGCMQVRIESVAHSDGICHEKTRESRQCHVGACARSDPCRVPFLVHTVFGFHGVSVSRWTLEIEYMLGSALASAARRVSPKNEHAIFEAGDVNVLLAVPWYTDDDDDSDDHKVRRLDDSGVQGMKVVVEISIANPLFGVSKNETSATDSSPIDKASDGPLQSMLRNISFSLGKQEEMKCDPGQLFATAKKAQDLNKHVLPAVPYLLIDELKRLEGFPSANVSESPFEPLYKKAHQSATKIRLIASWTIRTHVDADDINYFGPRRPLLFIAMVGVYYCLVLTFGLVFVSSLWWILVLCYEEIQARRFPMISQGGRQRYSSVTLHEDVDEDSSNLEDEIMGGDVELTPQSSNYRRHTVASPLKRRTTSMTDR